MVAHCAIAAKADRNEYGLGLLKMNKPGIVPVFALIFEEAAAAPPGIPSLSPEQIIGRLRSDLGSVDFGEKRPDKLDIALVTYGAGNIDPASIGDIVPFGVTVCQEQVKTAFLTSLPSYKLSRFSNPESALMAVATWNMRQEQAGSPVFILHVTYGKAANSAGVERAAGILKTAACFRGAEGCVSNIWLTNEAAILFPSDEHVAAQANPTVKSLFRMSSPLGNAVAERLAGSGIARTATVRCFEAASSISASSATRLAASFFSEALKPATEHWNELQVTAFLMPKEGETLDQCEDVVRFDNERGRFAISDGATTASYSAEWARALCQHSIESPPAPISCDPTLPEEVRDNLASQLKAWLDPVMQYWSPEIPWERLVRPAMFNKAKEGAGATIAGIEFLSSDNTTERPFRGWAIGDSCVIHLRQNRLHSSRPMAQATQFNYDPRLLMTRSGYEKKYVLFWQSWEATMMADDVLLLATDAFSEFVLKSFETAAEGELICLLNESLSRPKTEAWECFEKFVQLKRKQGELKNDDVGLILLKLHNYAC